MNGYVFQMRLPDSLNSLSFFFLRCKAVFKWGPFWRNNRKGFTLFETLAATMVLATALVAITQLFSGGLRAAYLGDRYTRAVLHAREKMEEVLLIPQLNESTQTGRWEDGFAWKVDFSRKDIDAKEVPGDDLVPFWVSLEVSWADGDKQRKVTFEAITLARNLNNGT